MQSHTGGQLAEGEWDQSPREKSRCQSVFRCVRCISQALLLSFLFPRCLCLVAMDTEICDSISVRNSAETNIRPSPLSKSHKNQVEIVSANGFELKRDMLKCVVVIPLCSRKVNTSV